MAYGLLITVALIAAYVSFLFWVARTGRMEKWNLSLMLGFILMIRTHRGRDTLDKIAKPKRFWNAFGDIGTAITLFGMAVMTVFLLWSVYIVLQPGTQVRALRASEILVIPGVNPFVPLWYGIIALIVTLVVHEGGHGVLARANNLKVKSLGLLFAVVPIGAFVEPDDTELLATSRRKRLRVFGAGPMVNLVVATMCLVGFAGMMGAAEPVEGAAITAVSEGHPAQASGLEPASIIVSLDGERVTSWTQFGGLMDSKRPGQVVAFTDRDGERYTATLDAAWNYYAPEAQEQLWEQDPDRAIALQGEARLGVRGFDSSLHGHALEHPFSMAPEPLSGANILLLMSLPIGEVVNAPYLSVYIPTFYDFPGGEAFLIGALLLFWIFWINLMVGLTNILPMLPLDGGHIFRDAAGAVMDKIRPAMAEERKERIIGRAAGIVSITILVAFLTMIFAPRFL